MRGDELALVEHFTARGQIPLEAWAVVRGKSGLRLPPVSTEPVVRPSGCRTQQQNNDGRRREMS